MSWGILLPTDYEMGGLFYAKGFVCVVIGAGNMGNCLYNKRAMHKRDFMVG